MKFQNIKCIESESLALADMIDGGGVTGYIDVTAADLPIGAIPLFWEASVTVAFAGTDSATMMVGVSGDTDAFSETTTGSVAAIAKKTSHALSPSSTAARTIRVTVTDTTASTADFGDFAAGALTLKLFFYEPEAA